MTTAREYAEQITATYDSAEQFAAVAKKGAGEWEIDRASEFAAQSDEVTIDEIVSEIESICRAKANVTETTVCGRVIQQDASGGQGHAWQDIDREDIPANIVEEIEGEIIDGENESCDDYVASNGQHYRW